MDTNENPHFRQHRPERGTHIEIWHSRYNLSKTGFAYEAS
jgi:hypothetical protein